MIDLELLEIHAAHGCNLTCDSCSHYSNQGHVGLLTTESADKQMALWSKRLNPKSFSILGGEPLLNNEIESILKVARKHWKNEIQLISNGFLLDRFPNLPKTLKKQNIKLIVSRHHNSPEYNAKVFEIFKTFKAWKLEYGISCEIRDSFNTWTTRYNGFGNSFLPFEDNDARKSWKTCPAKTCRQLFEGNIYKCSPITYLQLQKKKYSISEKWDPYLKYNPLTPTCSDAELSAFFAAEEEPICTMCPAQPQSLAISSPLTPFSKKLQESKHSEL
ncbi:radical SAM protein [Flavobacteriales bacterium]|nr:radical SAM protein [Flavobacteriales bacterium]